MISVALCTYNGQAFLKQQLESILAQTIEVDEIVICDDGSIDNTISIIESFVHNYPGIINLNINDTKLGVIKNFEKAIKLCAGDVIFLSDQDDVWMKDKVAKTVQFFKDNPQSYAVFSDAALIDESSQDIGKSIWEIHQFKEAVIKKPSLNLYDHIIFHCNVVTGACLAIKREALSLITPFQKVSNMYHDEWIALKLSSLNRLHHINENLISYRLHSLQETNVVKNIEKVEVNAIKRAVILGEPGLDALEIYRYWKRRWNALQCYSKEGFEIDKKVLDKIKAERKERFLITTTRLNPSLEKKFYYIIG